MGVHQFLGEGCHKKSNIYEELPKKGGLDNLQWDWQKIGRCFWGGLIPRTLWLNSGTCQELKIGLADVSALNFDQSFLQFNPKKKINAKKSRFEFKCWILKTASLNI